MSSTMSHPRSSLKRTSVSSTDSSESNYSESSYSPSPRNSVEYTQAPVRAPPRGSMQAFHERPSGRTMLDAFATAGRMSAAAVDVPPSRRRARVSFSVGEELRFYSPSHPPNKFLKPEMVESFRDAVCVDESRVYQPPPPPKSKPKRMTAAMAEARVRAAHRADDF
ncbi:hypothetical protein C8Q74DRAFT_1439703 [Fomes fomentarius]|nr:hypothetical protein C8Q74DRAFT_1439703 [Fomes fomentarius]